MINRIYQNKLGITKFNKYFSYLKDIRDEIDPYIYEFFSDERKYQLRGEKTLHDSWIQDFKISRELKTAENTNSSIELRLLLADWENVLILNYYDAFFEKIPLEILMNSIRRMTCWFMNYNGTSKQKDIDTLFALTMTLIW